jgi:hypothetical protein
MSRLNDDVHKALDAVRDSNGCTNMHSAVEVLLKTIDDESRDVLVRTGANIYITQAAKRGKYAVSKASSDTSQPDLFRKLHRAYALDGEDRIIKNTVDLTQLELQRAISIREKSVEHDMAHLNYMRRALDAVRPLWSSHPDWTFGQVCSAYRAVA